MGIFFYTYNIQLLLNQIKLKTLINLHLTDDLNRTTTILNKFDLT